MYEGIHTDFDIMKEFLIAGCELDGKYDIPKLHPINIIPKATIDFAESFSRKIKNHRDLVVNFYITDAQFTRLWNDISKYLEHLSYFQATISPDFSIALGKNGMPFPLNLYNKYRNHAISAYLQLQGIKVIPSVSIGDKASYDWIFDGLPQHSTLSVCTNGRVRSKAARLEFCEGFYEMCRRLEPLRVVIVGRVPEELESPVEIINLKSRNQQINERFKEKEKQCCGTCLYFNGETGDGVQFCDDKEIDVSENGYCSRYKKK